MLDFQIIANVSILPKYFSLLLLSDWQGSSAVFSSVCSSKKFTSPRSPRWGLKLQLFRSNQTVWRATDIHFLNGIRFHWEACALFWWLSCSLADTSIESVERTTISPLESAAFHWRPVFHARNFVAFQRGLAGYPANPDRSAGWFMAGIKVRTDTPSANSTTIALSGLDAWDISFTSFLLQTLSVSIVLQSWTLRQLLRQEILCVEVREDRARAFCNFF